MILTLLIGAIIYIMFGVIPAVNYFMLTAMIYILLLMLKEKLYGNKDE